MLIPLPEKLADIDWALLEKNMEEDKSLNKSKNLTKYRVRLNVNGPKKRKILQILEDKDPKIDKNSTRQPDKNLDKNHTVNNSNISDNSIENGIKDRNFKGDIKSPQKQSIKTIETPKRRRVLTDIDTSSLGVSKSLSNYGRSDSVSTASPFSKSIFSTPELKGNAIRGEKRSPKKENLPMGLGDLAHRETVLGKKYKHMGDRGSNYSKHETLVCYFESLVCFNKSFWYGEGQDGLESQITGWESIFGIGKFLYAKCVGEGSDFARILGQLTSLLMASVTFIAGQRRLSLAAQQNGGDGNNTRLAYEHFQSSSEWMQNLLPAFEHTAVPETVESVQRIEIKGPDGGWEIRGTRCVH
ncbi:hypothetical protein AYI68_g3045 [Smittium mucronatum]|uniref:Uncharacterized protein n=1 Tax=Smittium mucronatum TaxID=133383 RepID=A0A1R0H104_9FUNG|nr:hypothetical protein AYI68_g3045 [Smittium mucronatum]